MEHYIPISQLNDFIFCPYSIYLHSVYMETDENMYKATPQLSGGNAHSATNNRSSTTRKDDIMALFSK
ncbi:MAG: type V CRISPR-associated protein Cas4 [Bacteroidaceae bacterium]|nr:type V CRISPR-associated protein Cas4 [Bacteroidaceae bacterium]